MGLEACCWGAEDGEGQSAALEGSDTVEERSDVTASHLDVGFDDSCLNTVREWGLCPG